MSDPKTSRNSDPYDDRFPVPVFVRLEHYPSIRRKEWVVQEYQHHHRGIDALMQASSFGEVPYVEP